MRYAVETDAVDRAAATTTGAAQRLDAVDLAGLGDAVRTAMPGARQSAAAADLLLLSGRVSVLAARLADDGGRLRLAASQYASADAVTRAGALASRPAGAASGLHPAVTEAGR